MPPLDDKKLLVLNVHTSFFSGPKVTCTPQYIIAEFKKAHYPGLEAEGMHLKNTSCLADDENATHILFNIPLRNCGTERILLNDSYIQYTNEIIRRITGVGISYKMDMFFPINCKYDRRETVGDIRIELPATSECPLQIFVIVICYRAIFKWVMKENRYSLVFLLGLESSHYFLSQSVFKLKSIVPWSPAFSRASGSLFVVCCFLTSSSYRGLTMVIVLVSVLRQLVENYTNYEHCIVQLIVESHPQLDLLLFYFVLWLAQPYSISTVSSWLLNALQSIIAPRNLEHLGSNPHSKIVCFTRPAWIGLELETVVGFHSFKVLQLTVRLKMNCKKIYSKKKKIQASLFLSNDWVCYL